jgi:hypothetical protein
MGSETENKVLNNNIKRNKNICCLAIVLLVTVIIRTRLSRRYQQHTTTHDTNGRHSSSAGYPTRVKFSSLHLEDFDHCQNVQFNVTSSTEHPQPNATTATTTAKPIWFVTPPNHISENTYRTLINTMTGTSFGGKSYITSIRGQLKHCIGKGPTVTCLASSDNSQSANAKHGTFHDKYILLVRNPMTGFPAGYNLKSQKYRGLKGQNSIQEWRSVRDKWGMTAVQALTDVIVQWNATRYDVGMYLMYEDLYRVDRSLQVMKDFRRFLLEAGFQVVSEDDLPCVWYHAIGKETIAQFYSTGYEYGDYIPGYLPQHKERMLEDLAQFRRNVVEKDSKLDAILDRYMKDIEKNMVMDNVVGDTTT